MRHITSETGREFVTPDGRVMVEKTQEGYDEPFFLPNGGYYTGGPFRSITCNEKGMPEPMFVLRKLSDKAVGR